MDAKTFLGLDFSTQQVKAVVTDGARLSVLHVAAVTFEDELPEFKTSKGVHEVEQPDGGVRVTSPVLMWIKALEMVLDKLTAAGVDFSKIAAVSFSGQQHGSVYWKSGAQDVLANLTLEKPLSDQLNGCFSIENSPIWMDSSTGRQCKMLEEGVGGPMKLAEITGSRAFERFTGVQIAKIYQDTPKIYENTERISLVSSFAASLLAGVYAPIDYSDGSGMNLLSLHSHKWDQKCLDLCSPGLGAKLGDPKPSHSVVGPISKYFVGKYKFPPDCVVVASTGDNPSSLAGLNQQSTDVAISWGTSDTVFIWMDKPKASLSVHVFCNPVVEDKYMGLLCFKNGAFTRDRVLKECGCQSWDQFNKLLSQTKPGNDGNIGFFFDHPEILPPLPAGDHYFDKDNQKVASFTKEVLARAVIEHQCLAKRVHAESLEYSHGGRVLVTGGASVNESIMQILANVFNANVYIQNNPNSAALGAAYRAKHGLLKDVSFADVTSSISSEDFKLTASPQSENIIEIYNILSNRYKKLEKEILQM